MRLAGLNQQHVATTSTTLCRGPNTKEPHKKKALLILRCTAGSSYDNDINKIQQYQSLSATVHPVGLDSETQSIYLQTVSLSVNNHGNCQATSYVYGKWNNQCHTSKTRFSDSIDLTYTRSTQHTSIQSLWEQQHVVNLAFDSAKSIVSPISTARRKGQLNREPQSQLAPSSAATVATKCKTFHSQSLHVC